MKYYFDENFSPYLVRGLALIETLEPQVDIFCTIDVKALKRGAPDEKIIPYVANEDGILITQDINMRRTQHLYQSLESHGVGVFFFSFPQGGNKYWEIVSQTIKRWNDLKKIAHKENSRRPYAFRITNRGGFKKL